MEQTLSDRETFEITKIVYNEMKRDFEANDVSQEKKLQKFESEYLLPLYVSKRQQEGSQEQLQQIDSLESSIKEKAPQRKHMHSESSTSTLSDDEKYTRRSPFSVKELCLYLGVGNFFCWKSSKPDPVYESLGLGPCLYLKFIKHLVIILLILAFFAIMPIAFYSSIAESHNFNPQGDYQRDLFSTSVGSLSLEGINCRHLNNTGTNSFNFEISCAVVNVRVLGPVYSSENFETLRSCKKDIYSLVRQTQRYIPPEDFVAITGCTTLVSTCNYQLSIPNPKLQFPVISVPFQCINGESDFGATGLKRSTALIISVVFDLVYIVGIFLFLWSQVRAEEQEKEYFRERQALLNGFAVKVSSFSKNNFFQEFAEFLVDLEKQMTEVSCESLNLKENIVQVKLPDNQEFKKHQEKRKGIYKKIFKLMGKKFLKQLKSPHEFESKQDFAYRCFDSEAEYQKYKVSLSKVIAKYQKYQKLQGINEEQPQDIVIVFKRPKLKRYLFELSRDQNWRKIISVSEKGYEISSPPPPSQVQWDNLNKNKVLRGILSWTVSVLIIIATFVLIAYILYLRESTIDSFDFNVQCEDRFPNENLQQFNQGLLAAEGNIYIHCFCLSGATFLFVNTDSRCRDWSIDYMVYLLIPILFSIGIVIVNKVISIIYRKLSHFEAHDDLATELYSYIIKKTVLLVLNLALIVVILSFETNGQSQRWHFLFEGRFEDLTADWYLQIGIIVVIAIFFNSLKPIVKVIKHLVTGLIRKLKLKRFRKKDIYKQTKENYIEEFRGDVFPIEERYAEILAILVLCLNLNMVFPVLTLILALAMALIVLVDKVLIVKVFQKPVNFDTVLHNKVMRVVLVIILLHFVSAAFLLSEPFLLVASHTSNSASIKDANFDRIDAIFSTGYVLPYPIIFFIIIFLSALRLAYKMYKRYRLKEEAGVSLVGPQFENYNYYKLLGKYELNRTIALKKLEMRERKVLQSKYTKANEDSVMSSLESSKNLRFSDEVIKEQASNNEFMVRDSNQNLQQPNVLKEIDNIGYMKLKKVSELNIPDGSRDVNLNGFTHYGSADNWVFFDEYVRADYHIPELHRFLKGNAEIKLEGRRQEDALSEDQS